MIRKRDKKISDAKSTSTSSSQALPNSTVLSQDLMKLFAAPLPPISPAERARTEANLIIAQIKAMVEVNKMYQTSLEEALEKLDILDGWQKRNEEVLDLATVRNKLG